MDLLPEEINLLFKYKKGKLLSNLDLDNVLQNDEIGYIDADGYVKIKLHFKHYHAHRIIWIIHNGKIPPNLEIDHINCIRNDNRIENLRLVTHKENMQNLVKHRNNSKLRIANVQGK